jgi:hypothetical protein
MLRTPGGSYRCFLRAVGQDCIVTTTEGITHETDDQGRDGEQ